MTPCVHCPHEAHPEAVCVAVLSIGTDNARRIASFNLCGCTGSPPLAAGRVPTAVITKIDVAGGTITMSDLETP